MSVDETMNDLQYPYQKHQGKEDMVAVVRCKDCIHHHYERKTIPYCDNIDYGYGWEDDEYCSRGERRDG